MPEFPVPYDALRRLRDKLGLTEEESAALDPYRELFIGKAEEFADHFSDFFLGLPETRIILEHQRRPSLLKTVWARWFKFIFKYRPDDGLLAFLWHVGLRHVEVNLDQRFSNLGFSVIRQFVERVVSAEVPPERRMAVMGAANRLIDLCLLIETSAFIRATTRCDFEIIKGVSDKVRNRITVIGGNIRRLLKETEAGRPEYEVYSSLIADVSGCERLVVDASTYIRLFEQAPDHLVQPIEELISDVLKRRTAGGVRMEVSLDPRAPSVLGDRQELEIMLFNLIDNAIEAAGGENPLVKISSDSEHAPPNCVLVKIFNSGTPVREEDAERMFTPFYSTKPGGTGFGLPISRLIALKHFGSISISPSDGEGTVVTVTLPAPV